MHRAIVREISERRPTSQLRLAMPSLRGGDHEPVAATREARAGNGGGLRARAEWEFVFRHSDSEDWVERREWCTG